MRPIVALRCLNIRMAHGGLDCSFGRFCLIAIRYKAKAELMGGKIPYPYSIADFSNPLIDFILAGRELSAGLEDIMLVTVYLPHVAKYLVKGSVYF